MCLYAVACLWLCVYALSVGAHQDKHHRLCMWSWSTQLQCNIYICYSPWLSLFLSLSLPPPRHSPTCSLCIWKLPLGTWCCQPKGYWALVLVIVCNYPANLFTSVGAAWWSWGSNCQNGGKNGKGGSGRSLVTQAQKGQWRLEELIACDKCITLSGGTFTSWGHPMFALTDIISLCKTPQQPSCLWKLYKVHFTLNEPRLVHVLVDAECHSFTTGE